MRWLLGILPVLLLFSLQAEARSNNTDSCRKADLYDSYVLAMSWQPGFCEHLPGNNRKPECKDMMSGKRSIDHLTLHGLWPNRRSCGISYEQCSGRSLKLQHETIAYIQPWMPNWYYSSDFGSYEWRKHGTCQTALDDDSYFRKAVNAVITLNNSSAGKYLAENRGGVISRQVFFTKFNQDAGDERASDNLQLLCAGSYLYEIRVLLAPEFEVGKGVATMMAGALAEKIGNNRQECQTDRILIERSGR